MILNIATTFVPVVSLFLVQFLSLKRPADAQVMVHKKFVSNVTMLGRLLFLDVAGRLAFRSIERP
jgi:hypothetical protein